MRIVCPACEERERKEGRPLCSLCLSLIDTQLEKRWFNRKGNLRRAKPDQAAELARRLAETTAEIVEQAKSRRSQRAGAD